LTQPAAVPIVAYHSIANDHDHLLRQLSLPVAMFEQQLQYLDRSGFQTVTLYDVHRWLRDGTPLPPRSIALTFDDGYLDNWVYAFPLLKKYGMRATIFVATDFVEPVDRRRPTLADVWARTVAEHDLTWWGHVSWPELAEMHASGLVDVQAHTKTHGWQFVSDRIVDFHHPDAGYFWLDWNYHPLDKPGWLTRDFRAGVPWGTPVYEFTPSLLGPRYFDDPDLARCATTYVADRGGRTFFARSGWRDELRAVVDGYRTRSSSGGRRETDAEYKARVTDEMAGSRRIIAERLNKPVDFLCWPCGDYTPALQRLAIDECGFLATVNVAKTANRRGDAATELRRIVFGQDYAGAGRVPLVFMNFWGNVNYHSGRLRAYPVAPIARRLMRAGRLFGRVQ
jgi:hypothetical protein